MASRTLLCIRVRDAQTKRGFSGKLTHYETGLRHFAS
jgi:hypothetical protein